MYNVYGTLCGSYEEACMVAGIETPEQLAQEDRYLAALYEVENLKSPVGFFSCAPVNPISETDETPF